METLKTEALPGGRRATYWLVVERGPGRPPALTVGTFPDEEALAVFSFREEALLFLSVQGLAGGWTVTEVGADELISVLLDSCPARVALDPLPGPLGGNMVGLLSMERERFLGGLLRKFWTLAAPSTRATSRRSVAPEENIRGRLASE
jgi:hypothetical protein